MSLSHAMEMLKSLPKHLQQEVVHFIEFISHKHTSDKKEDRTLGEIRRANFGRLKGKIRIHPGFDDPVEGFEEYMP